MIGWLGMYHHWVRTICSSPYTQYGVIWVISWQITFIYLCSSSGGTGERQARPHDAPGESPSSTVGHGAKFCDDDNKQADDSGTARHSRFERGSLHYVLIAVLKPLLFSTAHNIAGLGSGKACLPAKLDNQCTLSRCLSSGCDGMPKPQRRLGAIRN